MIDAYPDPSFAQQVRGVRRLRSQLEEGKGCPFHRVRPAIMSVAEGLGSVDIPDCLEGKRYDLSYLLRKYNFAAGLVLNDSMDLDPELEPGDIGRIRSGLSFAKAEMARWFHLVNKKTGKDEDWNFAVARHPSFVQMFLELALLSKKEEGLLTGFFQAKAALDPNQRLYANLWVDEYFDLDELVVCMESDAYEDWKSQSQSVKMSPFVIPGCPATRTKVRGKGPLASVYVKRFISQLPEKWNGRFDRPELILTR